MSASSEKASAPLGWTAIRPWKTAFTVARRLNAVCEALEADGLRAGALFQALFLVAYDFAATEGFEPHHQGDDILFRDMMNFGADGAAAMPQSGASAASPRWDGLLGNEGADRAHAELWALCQSLKNDKGVSRYEIQKGLLRLTAERLERVDEASQRYWYRQFETMGKAGYLRAHHSVHGRRPPPAYAFSPHIRDREA